ncbi:unnamed protein product [Arctia plantaginis]|uniref:Uncharacterized protein n=1 Tax=Arctia plantaginis TaxID=874455 RepID=A0A8S0YQ15_ARCPL|nr:unnamed protein product [Arctia plantaginis]
MNVQLKVLVILILPVVKCETLNDLADNTNEQESKIDDDRFAKDLDDEQWHVAHLSLEGRRHCVGDTFEDRARRYRKALKSDGALVNFVSSDPIPFNVSEIVDDETCNVDLEVPKALPKTKEIMVLAKAEDKLEVTKEQTVKIQNEQSGQNSSAVQNTSDATSTLSNTEYHQATTPTMKVIDKEDRSKEEDVEKGQNSKSRRGEYMFSSIEYYDETPDFDASICPDDVDVIVLELDEIRSYDVECERIVEWRSLID